MKTISLMLALAGLIVSCASTPAGVVYSRFTTNADNSPFVASVLTNGETASVTFNGFLNFNGGFSGNPGLSFDPISGILAANIFSGAHTGTFNGTFTGNGGGLTNLNFTLPSYVITNNQASSWVDGAQTIFTNIGGTSLSHVFKIGGAGSLDQQFQFDSTPHYDLLYFSGMYQFSNSQSGGVDFTIQNTGGNVGIKGSVTLTNLLILATNASLTPPVAQAGFGIFWNSNSALYWITTAHTNLISSP